MSTAQNDWDDQHAAKKIVMPAMKSMRPSKQEKGEDDTMVSRPDGVPVRLEHEHIVKLGLAAPLPHGTKVEMAGHGEVTESGTHEIDGEPRHHMTVTLQRAGVEASDTAGDRRDDLKGDVARAADSVAKRVPEAKGGREA